MDREKFSRLVARALEELPEAIREMLENVDIVVADEPTREQLRTFRRKRGETLLGLYEGIPLTERTHGYSLVPPDKITIFQKPIEAVCDSEAEIIAEVKRVVRHEIAHHFGISDERLEELGRY
ncbi:MAG: metallopeptidase family protein [Dehalococcoidales bacterium]|nr:metallopeptidase family protein [Dehalococcoidales bacterium]